MYPEVMFALCAFTVLGLIGAYCVFMWLFTRFHRGYKWYFQGRKYHIPNAPNMERSPYFGKSRPGGHSMIGMYTTIDDPVMKQWAHLLKAEMGLLHSDRQRAKFLLAFVQQNVAYVHDSKQYGKTEYWQFPVNTISRRRGDCEDSAFLYACLCHLCGIDAINVEMKGHMTAAVNVPTLNIPKIMKRYEYNGKWYYRMETTRPFGAIIGFGKDTEIENKVKPEVPSEPFKAQMREEVDR